MNENTETSVQETSVEQTTVQTENTDTATQQETLAIEPRGAIEETEGKQVAIEGEILPDETSSNESESASEGASSETSSGEGTETTTSTTAPAEPTGMSIPFIGLSVIQCVVAFLLIVIVLQQSKSASSMTSSSMAGSGDNQSYWSQNKGRSKESKLARITVILGVIFFIVTIALGFVR